MKRIWLRLGLTLAILSGAALAGCKIPSEPPSHEFDGSWVGPKSQEWDFTSDGGDYSSAVGVYTFDFSYASIDEGAGHILINITKASGLLLPPYVTVGAQVYVMYVIIDNQMYITFDQTHYVTPDTGGLLPDGPFTLR